MRLHQICDFAVGTRVHQICDINAVGAFGVCAELASGENSAVLINVATFGFRVYRHQERHFFDCTLRRSPFLLCDGNLIWIKQIWI